MRALELLAPARDVDIAIEAIRHGADAVYIGPPAFGARKAAANSTDDIRRLVEFAHLFHCRVYVTLNTIIYENELREVERLISELYRCGVDALIVQDMGILRMDIPPIELHASTQCDIRTPRKALFLEKVGFSQLVLARELSLSEIREITEAVSIPVEVFVHGALCVSYSGRCQASFACNGRSGNRGECAQVCRLPFNLTDADGRVIAENKHLLSLRDFNTIDRLEQLVEAGASSFKIEGRLKDMAYVKNVVAAYSRKLDSIIRKNPESYRRASFGNCETRFDPKLAKSFNRGFTTYFLDRNTKQGMASYLTPKSMGESVKAVSDLNPGDGISFFDSNGNYDGVLVNGVKNGRIIPNRPVSLPPLAQLHRTSDVRWNKMLSKPTSERRLKISFSIDERGVSATDETGAFVRLPFEMKGETSRSQFDWAKIFGKLGGTVFRLDDLIIDENFNLFFPPSYLTDLRRSLIDLLLRAKKTTYPFAYRRPEDMQAVYPVSELDYRDNVANSLAERFYREHGVKKIQKAMECMPKAERKNKVVMTTRYCLLRETGLCLKGKPGPNGENHNCLKTKKIKMPLTLVNGNNKFRLAFDCERCEMSLIH